jgi:tRNA(Ile)-lysidine synthase
LAASPFFCAWTRAFVSFRFIGKAVYQRFSCDDADQMRRVVRKMGFAENTSRRFADQLRAQPWFRPGLRIGVGVSGGADSVALLTLLTKLRAELGVVGSAVHFNHRLRGKASDTDEKFVTALAEKLGVALHVGRADVAGNAAREKTNLEDAGRRARYGFFEQLAEQGVVDVVATAHTMDDQAETVLAHILRGTGIAGLAGIHPVAEHVVRPLLTFRREELRKFLRAQKQSWREDASNRDTTRVRARMRKKLLPLLAKEFNPAAIEHVAGLAARAREQAALVEQLSRKLFEQLVTLDRKAARVGTAELLNPLKFADAEGCEVLRGKLILDIVERVKQRRGQISSQHIAAIVQLAKQGQPRKRLQLPGGVDVLREKDALIFAWRREKTVD